MSVEEKAKYYREVVCGADVTELYLEKAYIAGYNDAMIEHSVKLLDSDCTCYGDHYGVATNPKCILHGDKR